MQQVSRGSARLAMQYQVLARKWRPQNFNEIVGQEHVSRTLLNALQSGRVAHAFLFSGPRGSGKTSTARILAKALNCHNGKPGEPCGRCVSCVEIAAGNSMDVLEIDAASNRGIDEIRELREKARYKPARDRNKIFIIDEVHMLTPEAFNALLKTLEEPPPHVVFILATTEYHKIPATILSRCQQYSFRLIPYPLILERLRAIAKSEGIQISSGALEQVVFSGGGSMRDAMSALDQVVAFSGNTVRDEDVSALLGLVEPEILGKTVRAIAQNDMPVILGVVRDLAEAGRDLHNFCRLLSGHMRNLMVLKTGITDTAVLGIPESLLSDLREQADLFSGEDLLRLFEAFQKIETGMKYATQVRFQLEMGLIELAHIARLRPLEEVVAEFAAIAEGKALPQSDPAGRLPVPPSTQRQPGFVSPKPGFGQSSAAGNAVKSAAATPKPRSPVPSGAAGGSSAEAASQDSRTFLLKIASAVGKESLESVLQSLEGARIQNGKVVLQQGKAGEFARSQIQENLLAISKAAAGIVGRKIPVVLERGESGPLPEPPRTDNPPKDALLEKAKRNPVVKSFLEVFPGPVDTEKLDK